MARRKENSPTQEELVEILRAHAQRWTELPNVTSVGIGCRVKDGRPTRTLAIQVTVTKKLDPKELRDLGLAPLPKSVPTGDGREIPVDVVQRSYKASYMLTPEPAGSTLAPAPTAPKLQRRRRLSRIMPGISVGHLNAKAGTIGAVVYDKRTGRPCVLSNGHILQGPDGMPGDVVLQPGRFDDSDVANNSLGTLLRSHVGLAGDCAIAGIETRMFDERILELGIAPKKLAKVAIGDRVVKSGRTTGVTRGTVVRIGVIIRHDYGGRIGTVQVGGFEIGPTPGAPPPNGMLCDEGDSGSLWVIDKNGAATDIAAGLHFAQQDDPLGGAEHALACSIHSVFEKLDVSLRSVA